MRLQGRRAIITGAASGIGRATTALFADEGATVLAVDRPESEIATAHKGQRKVHVLAQDIAAKGAAQKIVDTAIDRLGGIDIVMNNAGVSNRDLAEHMTEDAWDRVVDINLKAQFLLCQKAIPHLRNSPAGRIINVASVMAAMTDYGLAAYCASKAGVAGLTRTLALELGKFGITANYIEPGAIYTGLTRANFDKEEIAEIWARKAALRRLGQPIDIARGALFLASDDAGFVTGHGLRIDGGLVLRT